MMGVVSGASASTGAGVGGSASAGSVSPASTGACAGGSAVDAVVCTSAGVDACVGGSAGEVGTGSVSPTGTGTCEGGSAGVMDAVFATSTDAGACVGKLPELDAAGLEDPCFGAIRGSAGWEATGAACSRGGVETNGAFIFAGSGSVAGFGSGADDTIEADFDASSSFFDD